MRPEVKYVAAFLLVFLTLYSTASCRAESAPERSSPFTAVDWQEDQPLVQFEGEWYEALRLDSLDVADILSFCKDEYGDKWKKRFSEDLVEVLDAMGHSAQVNMTLRLRREGRISTATGVMTEDNRRAVWKFNNMPDRDENDAPANDTKYRLDEVYQDIAFLARAIEDHYAYADLKQTDYINWFDYLINTMGAQIRRDDLAFEIQKVLAMFGDGHTRVSDLNDMMPPGYLPFNVVPLGNQIVCLAPDGSGLLHAEYPFLRSINGISIYELLQTAGTLVADGSTQYQWSQSLRRLAYIEYLLNVMDVRSGGHLEVELDDGRNQTHTLDMPIGAELVRFKRPEIDAAALREEGIGYLRIPIMLYSEENMPKFEQEFGEALGEKGLIIDIRDNPGGSRALIPFLAARLLPPDHSPVVVNVAAFRTDDDPENAAGYLADRYLYPADSDEFDAADRASIETFKKTFRPEWKFDKDKFSQWHYMVVGPEKGKAYYDKPVVVLVNAGCFSAADVFTAALKEFPGVTIVGETTGGGSGRARSYELPHSKLEVRLSSMASFQPNGSLFDGNGVAPDVMQMATLSDILGDSDTQLARAADLVRSHSTK